MSDKLDDFDRACAAGWNGSGMRPDLGWDQLLISDPGAAQIWRRGMLAALREINGQHRTLQLDELIRQGEQ